MKVPVAAMAASQVSHAHSTDILFPEDEAEARISAAAAAASGDYSPPSSCGSYHGSYTRREVKPPLPSLRPLTSHNLYLSNCHAQSQKAQENENVYAEISTVIPEQFPSSSRCSSQRSEDGTLVPSNDAKSNGYVSDNVMDPATSAEERDQFDQDIYATPVLNLRGRNGHHHNHNGERTPASSFVRAQSHRRTWSPQDRRRTWSPPTFERMMGSASSSAQAIRSYHSNDQLDADADAANGNVPHDEMDTASNLSTYSHASAPPKITPVSGRLQNRNAPRPLIRPVAFKPIITPHSRFVSTPRRHDNHPYPSKGPMSAPPPHSYSPNSSQMSPLGRQVSLPNNGCYENSVRTGSQSHDDGYVSQEFPHSQSQSGSSSQHSHSNSNVSSQGSNSFTMENGTKTTTHSPPGGSSFTRPPGGGYSTYLTGPSTNGTHHPVVQHQQNGEHSRHSAERDSEHDRLTASYHSQCDRTDLYNAERPDSYSSTVSRLSAGAGDASMVTPPQQDDAVSQLRERDAEIQKLRETMERNESAILQVCEEKRRTWVVEMRELNTAWDQRLQQQQQKAFRTEQSLLLQLFQLQQDRKKLRLDVEQLGKEKEQIEHQFVGLEGNVKTVTAKGEETEWDLCQKTGEISLLKAQLKEAKEDLSNRSSEVVALRNQLRDVTQEPRQSGDIVQLERELEITKRELQQVKDKLVRAQSPSAASSARTTDISKGEADRICHMESELRSAHSEIETLRSSVAHDKSQWQDEKIKVVRYQKHLQLNYYQMMQRNKTLESEVEQLTLELEGRDVQLMDPEQGEESVC